MQDGNYLLCVHPFVLLNTACAVASGKHIIDACKGVWEQPISFDSETAGFHLLLDGDSLICVVVFCQSMS